MARRTGSLILVLAAVLLLIPRFAAAQEAEAPAKPRLNFSSFAPPPLVRSSAMRFDANAAPPEAQPGRSMIMTALYATTALTQGLDAHSTMRALNAGATERNPLMSFLTSHPPAFVALKTGAAAGLIFAGQRLAKHNKMHAVIALVAVNSAYLAIATHNYRVASRLR